RRRAAAAAGRGHAADVRAEGGRGIAAAHEATEEDRLLRRRDAGIHRAAERADEADVDAAARQLRVEAADDEPLRAGEIELDAAGRREHPGPGHRDADLQPPA